MLASICSLAIATVCISWLLFPFSLPSAASGYLYFLRFSKLVQLFIFPSFPFLLVFDLLTPIFTFSSSVDQIPSKKVCRLAVSVFEQKVGFCVLPSAMAYESAMYLFPSLVNLRPSEMLGLSFRSFFFCMSSSKVWYRVKTVHFKSLSTPPESYVRSYSNAVFR